MFKKIRGKTSRPISTRQHNVTLQSNAAFTLCWMDGKDHKDSHVEDLQAFTSSDNSGRLYNNGIGCMRV